MYDLQDRPTKQVPSPHIENQDDKVKLEYFHEVVGEFVDEYVLPNAEQQTSISKLDKVRWVICFIGHIKFDSETTDTNFILILSISSL